MKFGDVLLKPRIDVLIKPPCKKGLRKLTVVTSPRAPVFQSRPVGGVWAKSVVLPFLAIWGACAVFAASYCDGKWKGNHLHTIFICVPTEYFALIINVRWTNDKLGLTFIIIVMKPLGKELNSHSSLYSILILDYLQSETLSHQNNHLMIMIIFVFKSYFRVIKLYMSVFSSIVQKEMAIHLTCF